MEAENENMSLRADSLANNPNEQKKLVQIKFLFFVAIVKQSSELVSLSILFSFQKSQSNLLTLLSVSKLSTSI